MEGQPPPSPHTLLTCRTRPEARGFLYSITLFTTPAPAVCRGRRRRLCANKALDGTFPKKWEN